MADRRICVVTGSRAEYGLLSGLLARLRARDDCELQLVATGMHLSPEFGLTYRDIERDGNRIDAKVEMLLSGDSPKAIAKSIGLGVLGMADALDRLRPDILVVLGDRYEIFAAVQAAMALRLPVAHIHGGELSEGVIDEAIRHSITKMAHLHFVAAEPYRRRVIQLGEDPDRVFNVGAPGIDNIRNAALLDRQALGATLGFPVDDNVLLVTYHPLSLEPGSSGPAVDQLLAALDDFPEQRIVFTGANSDTEGRIINAKIAAYVAANPQRSAAFASLGQLRYLSLMRYAKAVLGNSSSGLIEAPFLGTPTVNIGDRQRGRLRAHSVIDCAEDRAAIVGAVRKALTPQFRAHCAAVCSLYGDGNAAERIAQILMTASLHGVLKKRFFDLEPTPCA